MTVGRRKFIVGGSAAAAWPFAVARAQPKVPTVGFLHSQSPVERAHLLSAFRHGLHETGNIEGQNLAIEYRWAESRHERLAALATDLVDRHVAVIAASDTPSTIAAKAATTAIPIVFAIATDPVKVGLVASMNRPGGNVTGVSYLLVSLGAKMLGLMRELLPGATRFAVLVDANDTAVTESFVADVRAAAAVAGRQIDILHASAGRDIDMAFASLLERRADALLVSPNALFNNRRVQVVTLAAHQRVPAIYPWREAAEAGGLMSYGTNITDAYHQFGVYVGRALKGEAPASLPVMQSVKFEFVINLNTAKAFGLNLPAGLLAIADQVIE